MTNHWKALLAVTIVTLTIANVNALPTPMQELQRRELEQNLGPTGATTDGDLNTVSSTLEGLTGDLDGLNLKRRQDLQRRELEQNLGPTGATTDGDLNTVSSTLEGLTGDLDGLNLKRRQVTDSVTDSLDTNDLYTDLTGAEKRQVTDSVSDSLDTNDLYTDLTGAEKRQVTDSVTDSLDTNDLYTDLTGAEKRSPLVVRSPVSLTGNSQAEPLADTGNIAKKRSPLLIGDPVSLFGDSKGSPLAETGDVARKRSPLLIGDPVSLTGNSQAEPLAETGDIAKKRSPLLIGDPISLTGNSQAEPLADTGNIAKKRSPLLINDPISLTGDSKSAPIADTGDVARKRSPLLISSPVSAFGNSDGAPIADTGNVARKRSPLLVESPVSAFGDSKSSPALKTGGVADGNDGSNSKKSLQSEDSTQSDTAARKRAPLASGLPLGGSGGGGGGDELLQPLTGILGGGGKGGSNPLSAVEGIIPVKREPLAPGLPLGGSGGQGGGDELLQPLTGILGGGGKGGSNPLSAVEGIIPVKRNPSPEGEKNEGLTNTVADGNSPLTEVADLLPFGLGHETDHDIDHELEELTHSESQQKRSPLISDVSGILPLGALTGGGGGSKHESKHDGPDGNVTPHSVSEAPSSIPDGRTEKEGTDIGAHLGEGGTPTTLHLDELDKDATNNHGSDDDKDDLTTSIGGDKPTKIDIKDKDKERLQGKEEGTDKKDNDLGVHALGGKSPGLKMKDMDTKKISDN